MEENIRNEQHKKMNAILNTPKIRGLQKELTQETIKVLSEKRYTLWEILDIK